MKEVKNMFGKLTLFAGTIVACCGVAGFMSHEARPTKPKKVVAGSQINPWSARAGLEVTWIVANEMTDVFRLGAQTGTGTVSCFLIISSPSPGVEGMPETKIHCLGRNSGVAKVTREETRTDTIKRVIK